MEDERRDKVRDHDFDGIQEFDNRLPKWWIGTFVVTVIFAVYFWTSHFTFASKPGTREEFNSDMAELQKTQRNQGGGGPTDLSMLAMVAQPETLKAGKEVFMTNCMACHGQFGQGVIGPNLTDYYWLHGGKPSQIVHTITAGVADKGMPSWGPVLGDVKIKQAAAYVISLHGSHPAGAKAPQGILEK